jgi:serine/threonine protein kinase
MTQALDLSWSIPTAGDTIADKYVVESQCGRGGLAVVLSANQVGLDRRVAIKLLLPHWANHADVVERFLREGRAATRITSEHVVRVFDVGRLENGAPFLVLEYLEGNDLDDVLRQWGPLPVATAIDWVLQATEAIAEAHAHGIVHRDLKPANLFLTHRSDGTASVKVIDFGLSKIADRWLHSAPDKLTRPTDVMGSPHYMAPEQLRASCEADARTDLWALGAVLHELMTGRPPFHGSTMAELCAAVLTQPPETMSATRADVPLAVEHAVLRCLEKEPAARFATVAELAQAIAPFGSTSARASCVRIERVVGLSPRARDISSLPPLDAESTSLNGTSEWAPTVPDLAQALRARGEAPSARVVLGSLLILLGLGAGSLMGMYASVHAHDPHARQTARNVGASPGQAAMQPSATSVAVETVAVPAASRIPIPETPPPAPAASEVPAEPASVRDDSRPTERPHAAAPAVTTPARPRRSPMQSSARPPPSVRVHAPARPTPARSPDPDSDDPNVSDEPTRTPPDPSSAASAAPADDRVFDDRQ